MNTIQKITFESYSQNEKYAAPIELKTGDIYTFADGKEDAVKDIVIEPLNKEQDIMIAKIKFSFNNNRQVQYLGRVIKIEYGED